jgi:hypothetical protein
MAVTQIATVKKGVAVLADQAETGLFVDPFGNLPIETAVEKWKREGRVYFYNRGNTTTAVTYTNTAILYTRPSLAIRVPQGKTVIPISLGLYLQAQAGVINEGVWIAASNDIGAGTSTAVAAGTNRGNMRTDLAGNAGSCLINITYSGDVTATGTNPVEFARYTQPYADSIGLTDMWVLDIKTFSGMPILVGPATLQLIVGGGTAPDGFATAMWAEFNSADFGF